MTHRYLPGIASDRCQFPETTWDHCLRPADDPCHVTVAAECVSEGPGPLDRADIVAISSQQSGIAPEEV